MQILFTYTSVRVYSDTLGHQQQFDVPAPTIERYDQNSEMKRITWVHTGKFVECNGCIVFQWRGTFDHEREAERQLRKERIAKLQSIGKEAAEWRDENAFWEDWKKRMGKHNEAVESEGPPDFTEEELGNNFDSRS